VVSQAVQTFFTTLIEDPKRRKRVVILVVVIFVCLIGVIRYAAQSGSDAGEILRGDAASVAMLQAEGVSDLEAAETGSVLAASAADSIGADGSAAGVSGAAVGTADSADISQGEDGGGSPPVAVFVDVGGAVVHAGVIALPPGSRITDAIEAAGGLTEGADVSLINRAQVVTDGDKLYIPTTGDVENGQLKPSVGLVIGEGSVSGAAAGGSAAAPGSVVPYGNAPGTDAQGRINLNTADSETLQLLNGVGPATAQKIIDYRSAHGQFKRIEDIMNVSGIGTKTYEKLKDKICV
jgi:competence protein ComEA